MIIVSQDKRSIVNFKQAKIININRSDLREIEAFFDCNEDNSNSILLGKYATEERAQEVLQEITRTYTRWENFKYGIAEGIGTPKYEMPKE